MNFKKSLIVELNILRNNRKMYTLEIYNLKLLEIKHKMLDSVCEVPLTPVEETNYNELVSIL